MGRGVLAYELFRTERIQLEQRTSDPVNPDPEEAWLRVDQKPTYEDADGNTQTGVAEYRVQNADGTIDTAPVAQLGHSTGSNVIDKVRPHVTAGGSPTGTGFVPYATQGATYSNRKLEHPTDGRVAMHDALTASAIPDSVVQQHDSRELTGFSDGNAVSTYSSTVGTDLTQGTGTFRVDGAYNRDSVEYDGVDDGHQADISLLSQPYTIYAIVDADAIDDSNTHVVVGSQGDGNKNTPDANISFTSNVWKWYAGNDLNGSTNKDVKIVTVYADGSNSYIREDATQTASGSAGTNDLYLLSVGYYGRVGGRRWIGDIPFVEVHDGTPPNGVTSREQDIIDDWGLSV